MRAVVVRDSTRDSLIGDRVTVAETSISRMVGLLRHRGLEAGEGLWIRPSSGVHTIGMKFAIDVIGIDKHYKVVKLWPNLVPYRITSVSDKVRSVVELPAGRIANANVQLGDTLSITDR
jgi:uncharacterized membrane protein (UPF0127 family)